jgi:hexosaminidase
MKYSRHLSVLLLSLTCATYAAPSAPVSDAPAFIPRPVHVTTVAKAPGFLLQDELPIQTPADAKAQDAAKAVAQVFAYAGLKTRVTTEKGGSVELVLDPSLSEKLGTEGYTLSVTTGGISLRAAQPAGLFYAAQTLAQAVVKDDSGKPAIPAMTVEDQPRFGWRGLLVDSGRHFVKPENMKRIIDLMAMHKMNILHWHLTEDQGWRIEIKAYPKLTEIGSHRASSPTLGGAYTTSDGRPYGGFYTQEQIKEIVAYAKARYVAIIPEIEMPGHAAAAIASYPELGNRDITGYHPRVETTWGVHSYTFAPSEETFKFIDEVIGEVAGLFPDAPFIHIGGDECPKDQWNQSPFAKKVMQENNLKDAHELQSYFIKRVEKMINARGKRIIGWDEIQEGGLSPTATMMVWRDWKWATMAVSHGNDIVMTPGSNCYLDHGQGPTPKEPGFKVIGGKLLLEAVYDYEPVPRDFTPEQYKHVLGTQGNLWSEYLYNQAKWEYMAFPRACALAEVAWSPREGKDKADFLKRLETQEKRLDTHQVNYRKADGPPAQPGQQIVNE